MTGTNLSKGERTRAALIEAAFHCFAANGYHGTSMRQIAAQAGLKAVGGIYNHFSGKEEIFTEVIRVYHPINQLVPLLAESKGETLEELFRDAARRMMAHLQSLGVGQALLKMMFIELVEFEGKHVPELFVALAPTVMGFVQRMAEHADELRPVPPTIIVRGFIGSIFAFALTELILADTPITAPAAGGLDEFMDVFLHGALQSEA